MFQESKGHDVANQSRRDFLKNLARLGLFGGVLILTGTNSSSKPLNEEQPTSTELLTNLENLKRQYEESLRLLNEIKNRYGLSVVYLPSTTNLAKAFLEAEHLENGLNFHTSTLSARDIQQILNGPDQESLQRLDELPIIVDPENSSKILTQAVLGIYSSLVQAEPGRLKRIQISGENSFSIFGNTLSTQMGNPQLDHLASFVHETIHGTDPSAHYINYDLESDRYYYSGAELEKALELDNKWLKFVLEHKDFMQSVIFSAQGDQLSHFLTEGNIYRVLIEFKAIATTNFLLGIPFSNINASSFENALNQLNELCREQLILTVKGWHHTEEDFPDILRETRENLGRGIASTVYRLLSDRTRETFLLACNGDVSRYRQVENVPEPEYIFFNDHTLPDGTQIKWGWDNNDASTDEYILVASFGNLLRYYGEILWPEGGVIFNNSLTIQYSF